MRKNRIRWSNDGLADCTHRGRPERSGQNHPRGAVREQKDRPYLAADRIASELNPEDPYAARVEAGRQFLQRLNAFIEERTSFVVESTLAGRSLARSIDRMNEAGYITRIAFVVLDSADLCVRRVQERVRRGGTTFRTQTFDAGTLGARRTSGRCIARRWIDGSCFATPDSRSSAWRKETETRNPSYVRAAMRNFSTTYLCRHEHSRRPFQRGPRRLRRD